MPYIESVDARIYYEEHGPGDGYPLLLLAPGGMNSTIDWWSRAAFNPLHTYATEFRMIAMDQRNAGSSTGPLDLEDPWGSYIGDQLRVLDHLGIATTHVMGCCIGCSYALKLVERAPDRTSAAVLEQPIGIFEDNVADLANVWRAWGTALLEKRDDVDMPTLEAFGRRMWQGDFVLSTSRDFVSKCPVPLFVLPGIDRVHPNAIGHEITRLAPDARMMDPWKDTSEHISESAERIREFLRARTPIRR
jgi:pimeloyl-ACP methyl ester carboxylesterase